MRLDVHEPFVIEVDEADLELVECVAQGELAERAAAFERRQRAPPRRPAAARWTLLCYLLGRADRGSSVDELAAAVRSLAPPPALG